MSDFLSQIQRLDSEHRQLARKKARQAVAEDHATKPERHHFTRGIQAEFPPMINYGVAVMLMVIFFAAATVSFFRTFNIARDHYLEDIDVYWQGAMTGIAVFLMAEFLVIASMLSIRIWAKTRFQKSILGLAVVGGTATALIGNWSLVMPDTPFAVVETIMPPFSVIVLSMIGEMLLMDYARYYQSVNNAYNEAFEKWKQATSFPEELPEWLQTYANKLVDEITAVNSKGRGKSERVALMSTFTNHEWTLLVEREINADNWFEGEADIPFASDNGNGHHPAENPLAMEAEYVTEQA